MKRLFPFFTAIIVTFGILGSCQKASEHKDQEDPMFAYNGPSSIELSADGSSSPISFTANRDWTVSTSDSWVSVSPSSGPSSKGSITVSVSCDPNTTYEDRSATVTIRMGNLTQVVTVFQPANKGIIVPTKTYSLSSSARSIEVEVQANVEYSVSVSAEWIEQIGTRGLVSSKLEFSIKENTSTNDREGWITIKALEGGIPDQVVNVSQTGKDAIIIKDASFDLPYGGGAVEVKVEANVEFEVRSGSDWIQYVQTKAMSTSTVFLNVDENQTYSPREGNVEIAQKGGTLSHTITIRQAERIAVSSVELNETSLILPLGESETLIAIIKPDNASDPAVTWESDHPEVATVNDQGLVTAVSEGMATITAKAVNGKSASCIVSAQNIVPRNQIWYTTASGKPVSVKYWRDNRIVSNTYENGKGVIVFEKNLETIPRYVFEGSDLITVEIPEGVEEIGDQVFMSCHSLISVTLPSSLKVVGPLLFDECENIERVDLNATEPPVCVIPGSDTGGHGPLGRPYNKDLIPGKVYVPDEAARDYAKAVGWKDYLTRLFTKSGAPLTSFAYKSTDYSKDGEMILLQKATVGRGVNILFLGDGFIDMDMETGGLYEQKMRRGMEILFCWEPLKTLRDRFNVYTVKCVSPSNAYGSPGVNRYFSTDFVDENSTVSIKEDYDRILAMIDKIPNPYNTPTNIIVLYNSDLALKTSHASWRETWGVAQCYTMDSIPHEFGHSFGWLSDEYITSRRITELTEALINGLNEHHSEGNYTNIDYHSNPSEVFWSHFISDPRYSDEGIGVFQGASESETVIYRPTFDSIMRLRGPFNAPSRETIYKHIMQWSEGESWTYDYEEFVKADAGGHEQWMSHLKPDGSMREIDYP